MQQFGIVMMMALWGCGEPAPPTFDELVETVFEVRCNNSGCHGPTTGAGGLFLDAARGYDSLLSGPVAQPVASSLGYERVVPGDPKASLLYVKVVDAGAFGDPMPPAQDLSREEVDLIASWIKGGALR